MRSFLFVRPDSFLTPRLWWFTTEETTPAALDHPQQLNTLSSHPLAQQVCLLLPACETLCRQFMLPDKKLRDLSATLTWMAEESMSETSDLHWHILQRKGKQVDAVAVPRAVLQRWLDACSQAGLQVVRALPDALLLDYHKNLITLAKLDENWLVRYGETAFAEVSPALLPAFVQQLPAAEIISSDVLPADVDMKYHASCRSVWRMLVTAVPRTRQNILTRFTAAANNHNEKKRYAILSGAIAYSFIIFFTSQFVSLYKLNEINRQAEKQAETLYRRYFPESRLPRNLKFDFERKAKQEGLNFSAIIRLIDRVKKQHSEINISKLEYDSTPLRLRLHISPHASEKAFIAALGKETGLEIKQSQDGDASVIELYRGTF